MKVLIKWLVLSMDEKIEKRFSDNILKNAPVIQSTSVPICHKKTVIRSTIVYCSDTDCEIKNCGFIQPHEIINTN